MWKRKIAQPLVDRWGAGRRSTSCVDPNLINASAYLDFAEDKKSSLKRSKTGPGNACSRCGEDDWKKSRLADGGFRWRCKPCHTEDARKSYYKKKGQVGS